MRTTRSSIGSLGFIVLVLAVDFAACRGVFLDERPGPGAIFAFLLLPMVDGLMIAAYRLREPDRRTPRAVGFLAAGSVATAAVFAACTLAPRAVDLLVANTIRPIARPFFLGLSTILGDAAMTTQAVRMTIGIVFEILVPAAFFCGPPLLAAVIGGWVGRRVGEGRRSETVPSPHFVGSVVRTSSLAGEYASRG